jgi:hypothetical protein
MPIRQVGTWGGVLLRLPIMRRSGWCRVAASWGGGPPGLPTAGASHIWVARLPHPQRRLPRSPSRRRTSSHPRPRMGSRLRRRPGMWEGRRDMMNPPGHRPHHRLYQQRRHRPNLRPLGHRPLRSRRLTHHSGYHVGARRRRQHRLLHRLHLRHPHLERMRPSRILSNSRRTGRRKSRRIGGHGVGRIGHPRSRSHHRAKRLARMRVRCTSARITPTPSRWVRGTH